ncbi:alpha-L-rhamnosidase [Agromyces archimandritae]|uniref:alpha-L-rhamnosidase n=1 Tax=Agromyces archimandritae TaxID=2781962 RepID=A0A975FMT7_9MICO|nr:alpha-L-rhamnosidase [Agromyces archimandritae]QTX05358.1 family 78 glycoside hydrolase catalytic domain [Agromyces archimandritae]
MALPPITQHDRRTTVAELRSGFDPRLLGVPLDPVALRWRVESDDPDARQLGAQLRLRTDGGDWIERAPFAGEASIDVLDAPLAPREMRDYAVRVATPAGWSEWSAPLRVEGGHGPEGLGADVVDIPSEIGGPVPVFRREFDVPFVVRRARLRISALGVYAARINGAAASDEVLAPGWTSYQERILVDTLDVTALLVPGRNAISIAVADGWYRGRFGFAGRTAIYGDRIGPVARLELEGDDGRTLAVATDDDWRGGFGAVRAASLYDGTRIDLALAADASITGFDDREWMPVSIVPVQPARFRPRGVAPVRAVAELPMTAAPRGTATALDAGQNISGWVRLVVDGRAGDVVTVRHAEVLEPDGALHTAALRTARATDEYVLDRDGRVELEPVFTFHGFRHAEVTGAEVIDAVAVAISSDLARRGRFSSSHATLDRFHENVVWSQRDNFVSVPTDCPQRDERLGWTGDAQAFAPTANTLFDTESFWASWLRDLEIDQTDEGGVASVVPNIIFPGDMQMAVPDTDTMGRAAWADAAAIVPLAVYDSFGGDRVLAAQLRSMRRWVDHLRRRAGQQVLLPEEPFQYGDWLDPDAPADRPWDAKVPARYVANAYYVRSARLLARAERRLGEDAAASEHEALADRVAGAVWAEWGGIAADTQTGAALALEFDLAPDAERGRIADALAANVRAERGRIATGFVGTSLVLFALSRTGHIAEAYEMLLRRDAPSWLYQVDRGATTVWERWDAIKLDGSIHSGDLDSGDDGGMISFNHYAYGAMVDWVYRNVAGLEPVEPGYRTVRVGPRPASALRAARAEIDTAYGPLAIDWRLDDDGCLDAELTVPFGVTAELDLPTTVDSVVTVDGEQAPGALRHGIHRISVTAPAVIAVDAPAS